MVNIKLHNEDFFQTNIQGYDLVITDTGQPQ